MEIWEGNAASLLTSAARCSMVMSSGPWPNRLRKGFCSSLQNKSTLTRWKKKTTSQLSGCYCSRRMSGIWFVSLFLEMQSCFALLVSQCTSTDFWAFQSRAKSSLRNSWKKSQSLAPVNTWKSRTTNPTMSGHTQFSKICISYPIWYLHRDVNDDFCSHIVTLFQFHWLGEFPAEVAGMCRNEFQRNPATQTKESLLLQSKLGQTALV